MLDKKQYFVFFFLFWAFKLGPNSLPSAVPRLPFWESPQMGAASSCPPDQEGISMQRLLGTASQAEKGGSLGQKGGSWLLGVGQ